MGIYALCGTKLYIPIEFYVRVALCISESYNSLGGPMCDL